jgi:hypothetical protein
MNLCSQALRVGDSNGSLCTSVPDASMLITLLLSTPPITQPTHT